MSVIYRDGKWIDPATGRAVLEPARAVVHRAQGVPEPIEVEQPAWPASAERIEHTTRRGDDDAEQAFLRIFAWVQQGKVASVSSRDGKPYCWSRGTWQATDMAKSPGGPYKHLMGSGFSVFLHPFDTLGHALRIDIRGRNTRENLIRAAAFISEPTDGKPVSPEQPALPSLTVLQTTSPGAAAEISVPNRDHR